MSNDDFISFYAIKKYIPREEKLKSATKALEKLIGRFNEEIKKVISDAAEIAKDDRKKTILPRHIEASLEKNLGKIELTWQELLEELLKQKPTDLGHISEGITIYLRKQK